MNVKKKIVFVKYIYLIFSIYVTVSCFKYVLSFLQVCLALRYFATGGNYTLIADFQGVTRGLVSKAVYEVSSFLYANQ